MSVLPRHAIKKRGKYLVEPKNCSTFALGEVAEWSIAAVLKTVELRGSGGSNPSLSARTLEYRAFAQSTPDFTPKCKVGCFLHGIYIKLFFPQMI